LSRIEAENAGEYAWTERVTSFTSWVAPVTINDVVFYGAGSTKNGFVYGHQTTEDTNYHLIGRAVINRCVFLQCTRGIYKPWGNIGTKVLHCNFRGGGEYGFFAETGNASQHIGNDMIIGCQFASMTLAGIYLDNTTSSVTTGQTTIRDCIIQSCAGFGIFVKKYNGPYTALTIDNLWTEQNNTSANVTVESTVYTPPYNMYFEDAAGVVIRDGNMEETKLVNSSISEYSCAYTTAGTSTMDSTSSRDAYSVGINSGKLTKATIHSYRSHLGSNDLGDSDLHNIPPRTHDVTHHTGTVRLSDSYAGPGRKVFTGSATVRTETVADGVVHSTCGEITVTASRTEYPSTTSISYTSGKWYAYSGAFKMTSATQPTTLSSSNASQFLRNHATDLVQNEWVHLGGIQLAGATGASNWPYITTQAGNTLVLRIADLQVVEFTTEREAIQFFNSKGFAGVSSEVGLLSCTTLDVQSTGQTTLYTVPTGRRLIIDKIMVVAGATASPTAVVTFGEQGSATDFLAAQTFTNLAAQYDAIVCRPVPNATPVKLKSYPAASIIEADVTTADADGGTDNQVFLYGTLY
jgi:hypothetical protein